MQTNHYDNQIIEAEKAFANNDNRSGMKYILQILNRDFTNDPAWQLLYRVMKSKKPFDVFQIEIANKVFPDKVHLLIENQSKKQIKKTVEIHPEHYQNKNSILEEKRNPLKENLKSNGLKNTQQSKDKVNGIKQQVNHDKPFLHSRFFWISLMGIFGICILTFFLMLFFTFPKLKGQENNTTRSYKRITIDNAAQLKMFDAKYYSETSNSEGAHNIAFSPDSEILFVGEDYGLGRYNAKTLQNEWQVGPLGFINGLIVSPDGQTVITSSKKAPYGSSWTHIGMESTQFWRISDGEQLRILEEPIFSSFPGLAISPDGLLLAAATPEGNKLQVIQVNDGKILYTKEINGDDENLRSIAISPDGRIIALSENYGVTLRWIKNGNEILYFGPGYQLQVNDVEFAPDGQFLSISIRNCCHSPRIYRVLDGKLVREMEDAGMHIDNSAFSPDGQILASADEKQLVLWRVSDGAVLVKFPLDYRVRTSYPDSSVTFSPDGKNLAVVNGFMLSIWGIP